MLNKIFDFALLKRILVLAVPIMLASLLQSAYQLTDSFWVGRLGESALAAVSINTPIIFLSMALGIGFSTAGSTLIAQYFGAKNEKMVNHSVVQTLFMVMFSAVLIGVLGYIFAYDILHFMKADVSIIDNAAAFLRISLLAILPNFIFFTFQSVMRSVGKPTLPVKIVTLTVLLNFILDPLFIFTFNMGVVGAGVATLLTQIVATTIALIILFRGKHGVHVLWQDMRPDFSFIRKTFWLGIPTSAEQSSRSILMMVNTFVVGSFGVTALAAYGVTLNLIQLIMFIALSLAMATGVLVGQNLGAGDVPMAERIAKVSARFGVVFVAILSLTMFLVAEKFVAVFVPNEPEVILMAADRIRIACIGFSFMIISMVYNYTFLAAGQSLLVMSITMLTQWVLQVPLGIYLAWYTPLGFAGIFWAMVILNIITAGIEIFFFYRGKWKKVKLIKKENMAFEEEKELALEGQIK